MFLRALRNHLPRGFLHAKPHGFGIHGHNHIPVFFVNIHEKPGLVHASVKQTNVNHTKGVDGCGNGGGIIFAFGYVHFNRNGFAVATGVDFVRYILCEIYVEVAETNIGALRGEMYCVRGAHALCGARDQDVFPS